MSGEPQAIPESVDLRREAVRALALLAMVTVACALVFGPPWAKRGLWWGEVRSHAEFEKLSDEWNGYLQRAGLEEEVTVAADGSGATVFSCIYLAPGTGRFALQQVDGPRSPEMEIVDSRGRPIPCRVRRSYLGEMWVLTLPADIGRDRVVKERWRGGTGQLSERQGADWVYSSHHLHGDATPHTHTVMLPPGSRALTADPAPSTNGRQGNRPVLTWSGRLAEMEYFDCRVRYRL